MSAEVAQINEQSPKNETGVGLQICVMFNNNSNHLGDLIFHLSDPFEGNGIIS